MTLRAKGYVGCASALGNDIRKENKMESVEFKGFEKISRLSRECIITEKIDGTNAVIYIGENGEFLTGSRTQWITPQKDNYGFSAWAHTHRDELIKLGVGYHYGEWWGSGCQRGYGLPKGEKRFSLFNVGRWVQVGGVLKTWASNNPKEPIKSQEYAPECCYVVPTIYDGPFTTDIVNEKLEALKKNGSYASPGFMKPEGIVIFHKASGTLFKKTIEKDEKPKNLNAVECKGSTVGS